ncbi:MAG: hypothetical protein HY421_02305 [Candidatus Kerfeldbacteria bacterium]|nr:hypothetical protein [Candidatus Kerfeldbacteria bacterium]
MRRFIVVAVLTVVVAAEPGLANRHQFSLSTGYNGTALQSEFNRGTEARAEIWLGRYLYAGAFDSRGLVSFGIGRAVLQSDSQVEGARYPMLTVFGQSDGPSGLELKLHNQWYWRTDPSSQINKWITPLFETEAGVAWQRGLAPKVRVSNRFSVHRSRYPGRSQGIEWVWEFRNDFPVVSSGSADRSPTRQFDRQTMRHEQWVFASRELGVGVFRIHIGATHKTVFRTNADLGDTTRMSVRRLRHRSGSWKERVAVLMLRVEYLIWRWSQ